MAWRDWVIFKRRSQHQEENVRYEPRDPARGAASGLFAIEFDTGKVAWSLTDRNIVAARGKELILAGQGPVIKVEIDELMAGYAKYWKDGENLGHDENIEASGVDYANSSPGKLIPNPAWMSPLPYRHWQADVGRVFVLLCVGDTILAGGRGSVSAINFQTGKILWQKPIDGEARGICAVDGRLIVSSTAGKLYCFGFGAADSDREITYRIVMPDSGQDARRLATNVLQTSSVRAGYALMLGVGDGRLLSALIEQSDLVVYCLETKQVEPVERVRSLRLNLNAPGDQMDSERRLWLAWPRPVDPKNVYLIQPVPVQQEGEVGGFRLNSDYHPITGTRTPWLYTSGLTGRGKLTLQVTDGTPAQYTVILHFAETEGLDPGERVFNVRIQGEDAITGLDVTAAAGGADRAWSREFQGVAAQGTLTIELVPVRGRLPVICAVEVLWQS